MATINTGYAFGFMDFVKAEGMQDRDRKYDVAGCKRPHTFASSSGTVTNTRSKHAAAATAVDHMRQYAEQLAAAMPAEEELRRMVAALILERDQYKRMARGSVPKGLYPGSV